MSNDSIFPGDFIWGTATAAYQIEGAVAEDGRGESIWDRFCKTPGKVLNGDTGEVACDHYHRMEEDLDLLKELGAGSYRFSISWPRIFPEGTGRVNQKGLDFYQRLVDGLLERDIIPAATLYHWDLPQVLQDRGGWLNRDTAFAFSDYSDTLFQALGDRISKWITINEPWVVAFLGHWLGTHAPGIKDFKSGIDSAHHLLLGHGLALEAFRAGGFPGEIGITCNMATNYPASESPDDIQAAERENQYLVKWFTRPVLAGSYPGMLLRWYEERGFAPPVNDGDMEIIAGPVDFMGINYYTSQVIKNSDSWPLETGVVSTGLPVTDMGWEIRPEGLYDLLIFLKDEYPGVPFYITENGAAFPDSPDESGRFMDIRRIDYLRSHFKSALKAVKDGVPLKGYYVWSLMDNFEWSFGYDKRFGIIRVDYRTGKRTVKASGEWCSRVFRSGDPDEV